MIDAPVLFTDTCIGCSSCVGNCPTSCIIMDTGPKERERRDGSRRNVPVPYCDYTFCIGCSTCVKVCPVDCLHMEPISDSSSSGIQPALVA